MRTIIAGSRGCNDMPLLLAALQGCGWHPSVVLSGAARGVDRLGEKWAQSHGVEVECHPADWRRYGRAAGYRRNAEMALNAEALIALWDGESPGTKHMIDLAHRQGLRVHVQLVGPESALVVPALGVLKISDEAVMTEQQAQWFDDFVRGYFAAALWSSTDGQDEPMDASYDYDDIAENTRWHQISECHDFVMANQTDLQDLDAGQCGHDFWLTRCGHGAGFWDRGLGDVGQRLTDACRPYGGVDLYVGDDGKVYASGCEREPFPADLEFLPPAITPAEEFRLRDLWAGKRFPTTPIDQSLVEKGYARLDGRDTLPNDDQPVFASNWDLLRIIRGQPTVSLVKNAQPDAGASTAP